MNSGKACAISKYASISSECSANYAEQLVIVTIMTIIINIIIIIIIPLFPQLNARYLNSQV